MDIYILLVALAFPHRYEAFVFTSIPNATITVCEGETVTFDWTYASGTPTSIVWTKRNNDATNSLNASVASFSIGSFIPDPAYGTRVTQAGNNAAIQLGGAKPADDGIYQVEVADLSDSLIGKTTLRTFESPVGTITVSYLRITGVVKCDGLSSLGSGNLSLVLDGNTIWSTQSLSLEFTPIKGGRCCCCVIMSVDAAKCLPAGDNSNNCSAHCVDVAETTFPTSSPTTTRNNTNDITSTTSATPGSTPGSPPDDHFYYVFLLVIPFGIFISVVVVVVRKRRKKKNSNSDSRCMEPVTRSICNEPTKSTDPSGDHPVERL